MFAIVELKNKDSWSLFLRHLWDAMVDMERNDIIFNSSEFMEAMRLVLPNAHHIFARVA